jgi:hypothetical protein
LVWRFANDMFEPSGTAATSTTCRSWRSRSASRIAVVLRRRRHASDGAEPLMQVLSLLAMDPPVTAGAEALARRAEPRLPRYRRSRPRTSCAASTAATPTCPASRRFADRDLRALRIDIDSCAGRACPPRARAGKAPHRRLRADRRAEPAAAPAVRRSGTPQPAKNRLRFRPRVRSGVTLTVQAKRPGEGMISEPVDPRRRLSRSPS